MAGQACVSGRGCSAPFPACWRLWYEHWYTGKLLPQVAYHALIVKVAVLHKFLPCLLCQLVEAAAEQLSFTPFTANLLADCTCSS